MTVTVRRYAEFRADFTEDHVWNADETDVVQTGGKAVTDAIADILRGFGCAIHEMEDNVGHCWDCYFSYEGLGLWFHVWAFDGCIFELEEPPRARPDYALHFHVLLKLNEQMRRDGRFHDLRWYEDGSPRRQAFDVPVVGDVPAVDQIKPWDPPSVDEIKKKRSFLGKLLAPLRTRPDVR